VTRKQDRLAAPTVLDVVRFCYGGLLLAAPRRVLTVCTPGQASPRALGVVRVLGVRQLLQAALTAGVLSARGPSAEIPPGRALLAGSGVDTAHAASMLGLALARRPLRRAALAEALLASSLAAFGIMAARQLDAA
jgi:hypothetical protein